MLTAIVFVVILGLLIFVHELGHFLTARRNGIKAEEFGFGFPPRICGYVKNPKTHRFKLIWGNKEIESDDTIYSLNWIPLGGFVKIKGENGEESERADSFASKSAWVRIKVLAAGVAMNFILAWVLIAIVFMTGASSELMRITDKNIPIKILAVAPNSPAEQVGLQEGDEIIKNQSASDVTFESVNDFVDYANTHKGEEINLEILRDNKIINFSLTPRIESPDGEGPIGVTFGFESNFNFFEAIYRSFLTVLTIVFMMLKVLALIIKGIFVGQSAHVDVSGPVGIALMAKEAMSFGLGSLAIFVSILSINLGVINILPIPALDGGRILFILIEKIKGSPVSSKTENLLHTIGFLLLVGLMLFVTFKDVMHIFTK